MTNIIKSALIIGSLLLPAAAFAGDAKKPVAGAGSGSAAPTTGDKKPAGNDVKKPVTKPTTPPKAGAGAGSAKPTP